MVDVVRVTQQIVEVVGTGGLGNDAVRVTQQYLEVIGPPLPTGKTYVPGETPLQVISTSQ